MNNRLESLLEEIRQLEKEVLEELEQKREQWSYEIIARSVHFREEVIEQHRRQVTHVREYLRRAKWRHIITAPIIWMNLFPALLLDLVVSVYQWTCFPIYGIPRVKRSEHVVIDRHYLQYLNIIEKVNCVYCGYFNGVISYVREVAARTEQYWCPIKHAQRVHDPHSRYAGFVDFGDGESYREKFHALRGRAQELDDNKENRH
ncbi:hypothetical protein HBA55_05915 [Pseudomaricurvus alkylphenolicus]|uniref:hypothetical protein n=1 Tax=Pseudomaricurvus alkylphenolicus TaxID=1306991 RepID=UPI00141FCD85|nr:hypothetical protein [Pseudomaricurvus alkylphenolicus]NIB39111.1 hypothetical protein [Pseudomaricurvus alkylphenolicus]